MIVMRFGTRLGALSWARTLRDVEHSLGERWWHEGALTNEHISVDLSEVGFADFVTLGHLLIFLHVLTNAGAEFSVSFPQVYPAHGTWAGPSAEAAILRRRNCRLYLDQSGFSDALSDPLIGRSSIVAPPIREAPIPDGSDDESADRQLRPLPRRSRRIMPYRWVPAEEARMLRRAHRPTNVERDLRGLGLSPEDAAALANGVLTTLLENSAADASVSAILLGGVLAEAETYGQRHRDFDPSLHDFVMDSAKAGSPLGRVSK